MNMVGRLPCRRGNIALVPMGYGEGRLKDKFSVRREKIYKTIFLFLSLYIYTIFKTSNDSKMCQLEF